MKKVLLSLALLVSIVAPAHAQAPSAPQTKPSLPILEPKPEVIKKDPIVELTESLCKVAENEAKEISKKAFETETALRIYPASCFLVAPQVGRYDLLLFNTSGESPTVTEISVLSFWTGKEWITVKAGKTLSLDMSTLGFTFYPPEL